MRRSIRTKSRRPRSGRAELGRVEAFSDGVLAIAITLLVLELQIPSGLSESEFLAALRGQGPQLFSFVLSFLVIGRFWVSHHRMFSHLTGYDDRLLVLNLVFLLSVVFLPFPTAVLGEYMHYRSALLLYAGSVALAGTLFTLLWAHAAYVGELVTGVDTRLRRLLLLRSGSVPVVFVATMPVIILGWRHVAVALWILVPPAVRLLLGRRHRRPAARPAKPARSAGFTGTSQTRHSTFTEHDNPERWRARSKAAAGPGPATERNEGVTMPRTIPAGRTARVYDRVAGIYDWYTRPMEALGGREARRRLFALAHGRVLELGVGTGVSLTAYADDVELTGIDISPRMLARARRKADLLGAEVTLQIADIEDLPFPDASFDAVTASCVFCSVPDPIRGLREAARVTRTGGLVLLYEHVRPTTPLLGLLADLVTPLTRRAFGPELNRRTEANAKAAGLRLMSVHRKGIWRAIVATPDR